MKDYGGDPMGTRKSIKVPEELVELVDKFIEKSKGFFRSRPEVVIAALEKFLKRKRRGRKKK